METDSQLWQIVTEQGNCRAVNVNIMYPEIGNKDAEAVAVSVCAGCVAMDACLEYSYRHKEKAGVWGGHTEIERRTIQHKRNRWAGTIRSRRSNG